MYQDLVYEPGVDQGVADPNTPQGFGTTLEETMIETASNKVAGGQRIDPRDWQSPEEEPLIEEQPEALELGEGVVS
jgi:hypothetical protein